MATQSPCSFQTSGFQARQRTQECLKYRTTVIKSESSSVIFKWPRGMPVLRSRKLTAWSSISSLFYPLDCEDGSVFEWLPSSWQCTTQPWFIKGSGSAKNSIWAKSWHTEKQNSDSDIPPYLHWGGGGCIMTHLHASKGSCLCRLFRQMRINSIPH